MFPRYLLTLNVLAWCALPCLAQEVALPPVIAEAAAKSLDKEANQLTAKDLGKVTRLDLSGCGLKFLDGLEQPFLNLRILDASENDLSDLGPLNQRSKLEYLDLTGNPNLSTEEVEAFQTGHPKCLVLFVEDEIREPNEERSDSRLHKLRHLDLSGKRLESTTGINGLRNLRMLDLSDNDLTSVDGLFGMANLEYLDLSGNDDLAMEKVDALRGVLPNCLIMHVGFSNSSTHEQYRHLALRLRKFDEKEEALLQSRVKEQFAAHGFACVCKDCRNLKFQLGYFAQNKSGSKKRILNAILKAANGKKGELDVKNLLGIYRLNLANMKLDSLDYQFEYFMTLMPRVNSLKANLDIIYQEFVNGLKVLDVSNNDVTDLSPLYQYKNLEYLNLSGNPRLKKEEVDTLREKLPNCIILHVD
jgi:Leucine-rich repeat (LRR) protein